MLVACLHFCPVGVRLKSSGFSSSFSRRRTSSLFSGQMYSLRRVPSRSIIVVLVLKGCVRTFVSSMVAS